MANLIYVLQMPILRKPTWIIKHWNRNYWYL